MKVPPSDQEATEHDQTIHRSRTRSWDVATLAGHAPRGRHRPRHGMQYECGHECDRRGDHAIDRRAIPPESGARFVCARQVKVRFRRLPLVGIDVRVELNDRIDGHVRMWMRRLGERPANIGFVLRGISREER